MSPPFNNASADLQGGRTLILCFDGTSDEFDDTNTNVVRLFSYLRKREPDKQLVYYQTGVGTYTASTFVTRVGRSIAKTLDLTLAIYLSTHVIGGYQFLQNNYRHGDKICLFGFSRGAYTARALAGMLFTVGLLPPDMPEQVHFAYEMYKHTTSATRARTAAYKDAFCRDVSIDFIGCWDTVASVGAIFPRILPFSSDNHITRNFRHALSLDEHRAKFRSNTWHLSVDTPPGSEEEQIHVGIFRTISFNVIHRLLGRLLWVNQKREALQEEEREEVRGTAANLPIRNNKATLRIKRSDEEQRPLLGGELATTEDDRSYVEDMPEDERPPTDVKEVWFAGCHADVGGGNEKDKAPHSLANIPLRWMIKEILLCDTPIIFRKSYMLRDGVDLDELIAQADHEKRQRQTREEELARAWKANKVARARLPAQVDSEEGSSDDEHTLVVSGSTSTSPDHPLFHAKYSVEVQQPHSTTPKQRAQERADVIRAISDQLQKAPAWWILEFIPFVASMQLPTDKWVNKIRINLGRPRDIPRPPPKHDPNSSHSNDFRGVNIPPVDALFHRSVKIRMEAEECVEYRPWWKFWGPEKTYYHPRAMRKGLKPIYVD